MKSTLPLLLMSALLLNAAEVYSAGLLIFDHPIAVAEASAETEQMNLQQQATSGALSAARYSADNHDAERFVLSNSGEESVEVDLGFLSLNPLYKKSVVTSEDDIEVDYYEPIAGKVILLAGETLVLESDYDKDGMADPWELKHGLDMYLDDSGDNNDIDYLSNRDEFLSGTNPASRHSDTDVLGDSAEIMLYGTDPHKKDTDDDGFSDFCEVIDKADPLDIASIPQNYANPEDCPFHHL